ncbi:polyketide cyclase/dehydrase/lipid transport protein [Brevibacterium sanguinis]|uniref:Polyketide cyclase/dehydrase/lipid transport protein n=2 Tax=Brevibacterium TaxID=1696 RepID=A0A366IN28_9MICO|nr:MULTISPECIES: SRPBCC family protein [Brevibacterium]RBP66235.1 polyketide cyclase/dehydrase/lipid transport protein [Brevibacterium sanguinis]RBP72886.1 polyketide cyclase/dehydrase/lipid transport protein [Brevibacterium celere]
MSDTDYPDDTFARSRTIPAPASAIFAILADPSRHRETEPGDWVRSAIDPEPITGAGQIFGMNMYAEGPGDYRMHNTVTSFAPNRTIAWDPGQPDETGTVVPGGWRWRYDLEEVDGGTEVTLTYDWSATPQETRDFFGGFPAVGPEFLEESLASLERAVTRS